jgi:predicted amidohydrolase
MAGSSSEITINVLPFQYLPPDTMTDPDERFTNVLTELTSLCAYHKDTLVVFPESFFKEIYLYDRRNIEKIAMDQASERTPSEIESESESEFVKKFAQVEYNKFTVWEKASQSKLLELIAKLSINALVCGTDYVACERLDAKNMFVNGAMFVNTEGKIIHTYHKQNLVACEQVDYIVGDMINPTFIARIGCHDILIGIIICADIESDDIVDKLLTEQPKLILNPSNCAPDECTPTKTYLKSSADGSKKGYISKLKWAKDIPVVRVDPPEPVCNGSSMLISDGVIKRAEFPYGNWTPVLPVRIK